MWKSGFQWIFLIMGTIIGAGYASGRELWQFFGKESGLAIVLFTIIFSLCCYTIMKVSYEQKTEHFMPLLEKLVGARWASVYDILIMLYLFTTTVVMLAGGSTSLEAFGFSYWGGMILFCGCIVIIFFKGVQGMITINTLLTPLLILGLLATLLIFIGHDQGVMPLFEKLQRNWPSAFTFTSLNVLSLVAVLAAVGKKIKSIEEIKIASIGSGLIIGFLSFIYNRALLFVESEMSHYEIPLFAIMKSFPYLMSFIMTILLISAIYTTAVSSILGFLARIKEAVGLPLPILAVLLLLIMVPFTMVGFSTLIAVLYPIYGILNLYLLAGILAYPIINRYKSE